MSGIALAVNGDEKQCRDMVGKVLHRGSKVLIYSDNSLALASCSDSRSQKKDMEYLSRYILAFDGEVYNRRELEQFTDTDKSDEEILASLYNQFGLDCLEKINGIFSFVLYDKTKKRIFGARDRFGVKPLYYAQINNSFFVSSEIKQFTAINGFKAVLNNYRAYDFLVHGTTDHTSETLFKNIFSIRGGEYFEFDLSKTIFTVKKWYSLKDKIKPVDTSFDKGKQEFAELFYDSIKLRLGENTGALLSGGLDSSAIVCVASKLSKESKLETVSACFEEKNVNEIEYIDAVIEKTHAKSHRVNPSPNDLLQNLNVLAYQLDEPYASTSIFAQYCVYKTVKANGLEIVLDGQGADEILAGYIGPAHKAYFAELKRNKDYSKLESNIKGYETHYGVKYRKVLSTALIRRFAKKIFYFRSFKLKSDGLFYKTAMKKTRSLNDYLLKLIEYASIPMIFRYEDRNSAIHSVNFRVPFADHRLVEFVLSLPADFIMREGKTKYLLRESLKDVLPLKISERYPKIGFASPENIWIHENKQFFRKELENACDLAGKILNKKKILKQFDATAESGGKFHNMLWRIISFGRWFKVFEVEII